MFFLLSFQLAPIFTELAGNTSTNQVAAVAPTRRATATPTATIISLTELLQSTVKPTATPVSADPGGQSQTLATASVSSFAVVDGDYVNLRNYPSLAGEIVGQVRAGDRLEIVATSNDGLWVQVCCPLGNSTTKQSWLSTEFIRREAVTATPVATPPQSATPTLHNQTTTNNSAAQAGTAQLDGIAGTVNADLVNIRSGPGTNYAVIGQAVAQTQVELIGRNAAGDWWRVCCPAGANQESWLSATLIDTQATKAELLKQLPVVEAPPPPVAVVNATVAQGGNRAAALQAASGAGLPGAGSFGAPGSINPLTGLSLAGGMSSKRPVIVCVNNDYAARPQLGLGQADVVYEYLMEGYGITRFSAIYYGEQAAQIGPVRSARLINYYMGALYQAGLACSGASDQVRYTLKHEAPFPYMDIDLDDPSNSRYSVSIGTDYRTRLRTSTDQLRRWLADWGVEEPAAIRGFTFGDLPGGGAAATTITIPYPRGTASQVDYRFDAGSGRYLRSLGGVSHLDGNSGLQLALENVIVQYVVHQATDIVEDSLGSTSIRLNLFGSGRALVFRDGLGFEGSWHSDSRGDTPHFFNAGGTEIPLKPGRSWISVVPDTYTISYQ